MAHLTVCHSTQAADNKVTMNALDFTLGLLLAAVTVVQTARGFGRAVLDALALYAALWLASTLATPLAALLPSGTADALACAYGVLLVSCGAGCLLLSRWAYSMTLVHTGMFEGLLGMAAGAACGMMAAHGIARALTLADPAGQGSALLVQNGFLAHEMLSFPTYHAVLNTLTGITSSQRQLPDVNA